MSDRNDDALVALLSSFRSRRGLGRLAAATLAFLGLEAGIIAEGQTASAKRKKKKKNKQPSSSSPTSPQSPGAPPPPPPAPPPGPPHSSSLPDSCTVECNNLPCGADGCLDYCGTCPANLQCSQGQCQCINNDVLCGPNCEPCPANQYCSQGECWCRATFQRPCNGTCCPADQFCSNGTCFCFEGNTCGDICCTDGRVCIEGQCQCPPGTECNGTCCPAGTMCGEGNTCCRTSCVGVQCGIYRDTCDGEPLDCGTSCRVGGAFCSNPQNGGICVCSLRERSRNPNVLVCS